jgi:hypothetical protein
MSNQDFNPDTHVKGEDGKIYEKRAVTSTGVAVGQNTGEPKTALAEALEKAMTKAVEEAHAAGESDPNKIRGRILAARDAALASE